MFRQVWIFGDVWCAVWLAVDVWMCTASILNLCAISLDRYVAVTRPVTYPSIMSPRRAKMLIAGVWVLSFVICFPPLVGWKDSHTAQPRPEPCPWTCELTNDTGYVLYSALGSFYLPMLVMLFFYWRIYRAAVRTTHAINQGFRTTRGVHSRFDDQRLTLRIHRGRGSLNSNHDGGGGGGGSGSGQPSPSPSSVAGRSPSARRVKISVSYPSSDAICGGGGAGGGVGAACPQPASPCGSPPPPGSPGNNSSTASTIKSSSFSASPPGSMARLYAASSGQQQQQHLRVTGARLAAFRRNSSVRIRRRSSSDSGSGTAMLGPGAVSGGGGESAGGSGGGGGGGGGDKSPSPTYEDNGGGAAASGGGAACGTGGGSGRPKLISRMGKRNIKSQVKRFRMETKAAKTLGIIVGGFIVCWLPFFTMYVVRAFCTDAECIPAPVFSVLFWLGYCNSAINPCIYALFSRDFRFAFTRILCRCAGGRGGWGRRAASPGGAESRRL
ncbi:octopamine receptor Oamb-like [Schistocerca cancellata]|uniref:octopamine receptor Oamb-like n=1 Tax=Schistocerca cancellata TaxID=274614 RepID=UPI0021194DB2|nr:octopamine receptor Oamb-like [Schistocerca cancellata]